MSWIDKLYLVFSQYPVVVFPVVRYPCDLCTFYKKNCHYLIIKALSNASASDSIFSAAKFNIVQICYQHFTNHVIALEKIMLHAAPNMLSGLTKFAVCHKTCCSIVIIFLCKNLLFSHSKFIICCHIVFSLGMRTNTSTSTNIYLFRDSNI